MCLESQEKREKREDVFRIFGPANEGYGRKRILEMEKEGACFVLSNEITKQSLKWFMDIQFQVCYVFCSILK